jgi:phosphomethylpyrimidine synthase
VRVYAEEQRIAALELDQEVEQGMQAKAEEFKAQGAQLYHKV